MAKKGTPSNPAAPRTADLPPAGRPSALLDTRVVYCGDNLEQLKKLPDRCPQRRRSRSERSAVSGDAARSRNLVGL